MSTAQRQRIHADMVERIERGLTLALIRTRRQYIHAKREGDILRCVALKDKGKRIVTMLAPQES